MSQVCTLWLSDVLLRIINDERTQFCSCLKVKNQQVHMFIADLCSNCCKTDSDSSVIKTRFLFYVSRYSETGFSFTLTSCEYLYLILLQFQYCQWVQWLFCFDLNVFLFLLSFFTVWSLNNWTIKKYWFIINLPSIYLWWLSICFDHLLESKYSKGIDSDC